MLRACPRATNLFASHGPSVRVGRDAPDGGEAVAMLQVRQEVLIRAVPTAKATGCPTQPLGDIASNALKISNLIRPGRLGRSQVNRKLGVASSYENCLRS